MATLSAGAVIGIAALLIGGVWRIFDDDRIKQEQEKEIKALRKKVDDLENGLGRFDKVANMLDSQLDKLAQKLEDKF